MKFKALHLTRILAGFLAVALVVVAVKEFDPSTEPLPASTPTLEAETAESTLDSATLPDPVIPAAPSTQDAVAAADLSKPDLIRQLDESGAKRDQKSLEFILRNLNSADAEVREAAVAAVVQTGNTSAIPQLERLVESLENPREKTEVLDAIELLRLPSFKDVRPPRGERPANPER